MKKITDKQGELRLSIWKVFVMSIIVVFFTFVAKSWELKHRLRFNKTIPYKTYSKDKISAILNDFHILATCQDPYIENFQKKHPEFSSLHNLWTLNSNGYWKEKLNQRLCKLNGEKYVKPKAKKKHIYPTSKKLRLLDKIDYWLVDYFGNQCEVRSLDFFISWAKCTEKKYIGKPARKLYEWFTNYYAGLVVPVDNSLGRGIEIMPYEGIVELVKRAKVGQIWPCSCKSFRQADAHIPRGTCMLIAEVASLDDSMTKYPDTGFMVAEDVLKKLKEFEDIGLVHQIMCVSSPQGRKMYVLCNCDDKACVPVHLKVRYNIPMVKSSGFVCIQEKLEDCLKCGKCKTRCYFNAIKYIDGLPETSKENCLGCGLCVTSCPAGIRKMIRFAKEPIHHYTQEQIKNHPEKTIKT